MIVICSDATHIETVSSGDEPCQEAGSHMEKVSLFGFE